MKIVLFLMIYSQGSNEQKSNIGSHNGHYLNQLEQLERLRSENTPHCPMITHTIDSYQTPSQKIWKEF